MWGLTEKFGDVTSVSDERSNVTVGYQGENYPGWVTIARKGRKTPAIRLWYSDDLAQKLKYSFLMSYMRSLEQRLTSTKEDIEKRIPFWEFLDIEFNAHERRFIFTAYYRQEPSFPNLFERLIGSPGLKRVSDELEGKRERRIYKQDWKKKEELNFEIGATNVLYLLIDTHNKLLYAGEAKDLISRLNQPHSSIPEWDHYRYSVLPSALAPFRVALERMLIRDLATLFPNKKNINSLMLSDYQLANDRIDR